MSGLEEMSREELIALTRALTAENAALRERVAKLERLLSRNSGNSGMPPSMDDLPGRKQPKDRAVGRDRRRPGKQPGAEGKTLAWADEVAAGDIVEHFPQGPCGCGVDLGQAADLGVTARHQQMEIPLVVARRLEHRLHTVARMVMPTRAASCPMVSNPAPPGTCALVRDLEPSVLYGWRRMVVRRVVVP
ncbi:DUF6444 domain-containing protein [Nonomuraea polychroma]|uniref:DUF6444 domain-containing protein n=1 Tax=Nonomuraea polychroma TaxID=46176 RepID=UPI003D943762